MSLKKKLEALPFYNQAVKPLHFVQAVKAGVQTGWPAKGLRVIGVTGTNGKTTTSFMIWKMLNEAGHKTGLLTTVGWSEDGKTIHPQYEHMTTERVEILDARIKKVKEAGAEFLVLETTSHALSQSRTLGVPIEIAVFTNLTHEHLDYHKTFANYRKAKMKLFKRAKIGVVNADDKNARWFEHANAHGDIITYGIEKGDLRATDIELSDDGVNYSCGDIKITTNIPGKFNVYNSLAAVAVGKKLGLKDDEIENGIRSLESVEGRMNRIEEGQNFSVIVDYAHTPDALVNVFESVEDEDVAERGKKNKSDVKSDNDGTVTRRKIIAVHGGAGRRDESTREIRGEILGKYSDIVIVTEDDTRDEDPEKIAEMIAVGVEKTGKRRGEDLLIELDRYKAIEKAIKMAKKGDLVLILGKGHEKTILRNDGAHEFEDTKVSREILRGLKK